MPAHHYQIAVTGTPLAALTYQGEASLLPGMRVIVPLGQRQQVGVVLQASDAPVGDFVVKSISHVLDATPLWTASMLSLLSWCSQYYHAPIGKVLDSVLPPPLKQAKVRTRPHRIANITGQLADGSPVTLNEQQQQCVTQFQQQGQGFHAGLLAGITGSGKTEVYATLIADCLAQGKQALLLVPEIGLTPQMLARLHQRLGVEPLVLHSEIADGQRAAIWFLGQTGTPMLLIGTRSAVFAPLPNLGLMLVDEEHDTSYKQQDGIRYHARDVAVMRAHLQACPILLGSATPSLESLHNVQTGKYQHYRLTLRANAQPLPQLSLIDMRQQTLTAGLSPALISHIEQALAQDSQVLLFLNRRGYAPVLMCHDCGHTLDCTACDAPYTLHRQAPNLRCHHCGRVAYTPSHCPSCGAQHWQLVGQGTQQLEEALIGLFPNTPILRLDRDNLQGKGTLETALAQAHQAGGQILLGTQLLAKGHDIANIGLVGIVDVDGALFARDYRALERLAQLVTQVSGRAGRGEKGGRVLLQTHQPQHPFVQALLHQSYAEIAADLLKEREQTQLPPFAFSAYLLAEGRKAEPVRQHLEKLLNLPCHPAVQIAGPMAALMHKRQHHYRELLWLQSASRSALHQQITAYLDTLNTAEFRTSSVKVSWDIDPQDMP